MNNTLTRQKAIELISIWGDQLLVKRKPKAVKKLLKKGGTTHGFSGFCDGPIKGRKGLMRFQSQFLSQFPSIDAKLTDIMVDGNKICATLFFVVEHRSGKKAHMNGITIATVENGAIVSTNNVWDFMNLYTQIGILPKRSFRNAMAGKKTAI